MNSFEEAILKQNTFGEVCTAINNLILLAEKYPQITNCIDYPNEKKESNFVEYQHKESIVERVLFRDRSHPIDTVMLNDFNRKSGTDIETVKLEYGPSANEYTRSHHALAIAVANEKFIFSSSKIAPAFNQQGGGIQYEFGFTIKTLLKIGYLKEK